MGIEQKVAIITGASQGIGAALVQGFRDRNYRVVATARSIKPSGDDDVLAVAGDIADRATAERVVAQPVFINARQHFVVACIAAWLCAGLILQPAATKQMSHNVPQFRRRQTVVGPPKFERCEFRQTVVNG